MTGELNRTAAAFIPHHFISDTLDQYQLYYKGSKKRLYFISNSFVCVRERENEREKDGISFKS